MSRRCRHATQREPTAKRNATIRMPARVPRISGKRTSLLCHIPIGSPCDCKRSAAPLSFYALGKQL